MSQTLRILADENIPGLQDMFGDDVDIKSTPGRDIQRNQLRDVDVLLVRSVTRVNEDLLAGTPVRFVGTATIGLDHVDLDYLQSKNIGFAYAPGSNAQSVVEYVLAAMAYWLQHNNRSFSGLTVGIVGVGRIGSLLHDYLNHMDVTCLLCDPPRQARESLHSFVSLEETRRADVISFHVPLTHRGPWPTRHLIDASFLTSLRDDQLLINTARGDILDNQMACHHFQNNSAAVNLVLDVWQNEPMIQAELVPHCLLATPHVAGYAIEGKWRATGMLCRAVADYFNVSSNMPGTGKISESAQLWTPQSGEDWVSQLLTFYAIKRDDAALRNGLNNLPHSFDKLRKNYPVRHEFLAPLKMNGPLVG